MQLGPNSIEKKMIEKPTENPTENPTEIPYRDRRQDVAPEMERN